MKGDPISQVLDSLEPLGRGPTHHPVDLVALVEQQLGQVRTVLTRNAGDQSAARGGHAAEDYMRVGGDAWLRTAT